MSWQVSLALRGDLQAFMDAEVKAGKQAVTTIIRRRTTQLRNNLRRQVGRARLGDRLGKTIKGQTYPGRGVSLNAAGRVFSKALYKRKGGLVDLIAVFDKKNLLQPTHGPTFLAIPNIKVTGRGTGVRGHPVSKSPQDPEFAGQLQYRETAKANVSMLVLKRDRTKVAFWLVKIARIGKRLNVDKAYAKAIRNIDQAVATQWERNDKKVRGRFSV